MNSQSVNGDAGINEQMAADQRVTADPVRCRSAGAGPASPNDMTPNDDMVERPGYPWPKRFARASGLCARRCSCRRGFGVAVEGDAGQVLMMPQRSVSRDNTRHGRWLCRLEVPDWAVAIGGFLHMNNN